MNTVSLYRYSRHPFLTYGLLSLWMTPLMTLDRFVWAAVLSAYGIWAPSFGNGVWNNGLERPTRTTSPEFPNGFPCCINALRRGIYDP